MRFSTRTLRIGQDPDREHGAVINPIYQSATFVWENLDTMPKHDYTRVVNPNRTALEAVLAEIENARYAVAFGSGMAAIAAAFSLLEAGDHLIIASDIYGGTYRLAKSQLTRQGIDVDEFDASRPESLREAVKQNTKLVIFESPTNPTLKVMDVAAIAAIARECGILSVVDNTFASPYLQTPIDLGVDVVVHSTTKYISGHSDVIGGALITNHEFIYQQALTYIKTVGSVPSPFDCWLTIRGVKTLAVRMERHCANAQRIAEYLSTHARVKHVYYPGLESDPGHELAKRQMKAFGGMVSFEVDGTTEQTKRFAEACRIFQLAESLGGVESIIGYPPVMSHGCMSPEERYAMGVYDTQIRLSVGIEDVEDLIEDLELAFETAFARETAVV
ncbi:MAG: PLP-dependent transferase [Methanoregulaceae archaeon]|nr:PLP-dependent transferase [Methanoregulaceae archaeon]